MIEWIKTTIHLFDAIMSLCRQAVLHTIPMAKRLFSRIKFLSKQWKTLKQLRHSNDRRSYKKIFIITIIVTACIEVISDIPLSQFYTLLPREEYEEVFPFIITIFNKTSTFIHFLSGATSAMLVSLTVATSIKYGLQLISWRWSIAGLALTVIVTIINSKYLIVLHLCEVIGRIIPQNSLIHYYGALPYTCTLGMIYVSAMVLMENCVDMIFCCDALLNRIIVTPVSETDPDVLEWQGQLRPLLVSARMKSLSGKTDQ